MPAPARALARGTERRIAIPALFEENVGQADRSVRFLARRGAGCLLLTDGAAITSLLAAEPPADPVLGSRARRPPRRASVTMEFLGTRPDVVPGAVRRLAARARHVRGDGEQRSAPVSLGVRYPDLWEGIDLVFRGDAGTVRYELHLDADARLADARWRFPDAAAVSLDGAGNLVLDLGTGTLVHTRPRFFEILPGTWRELEGRFVLGEDDEVALAVDSRTAGMPLIVDPEIVFSSYLEGPAGGLDSAYQALLSDSADVSVAGPGEVVLTFDVVTADPGSAAHRDILVMALDLGGPANAAVEWVTLLGDEGEQHVRALAVDAGGGRLALVGATDAGFAPGESTEFVDVSSAPAGGTHGLVVTLDATGGVLASAVLTGNVPTDVAFNDTGAEEPDIFIGGTWLTGGDNLATDGAFQAEPRDRPSA